MIDKHDIIYLVKTSLIAFSAIDFDNDDLIMGVDDIDHFADDVADSVLNLIENETNKINIKGENKNTMENKNTDFIKQAAQHINALHKLCKDFNIQYFNVTCGKDYSSDFHSFEGEFRTFEGDIHYNEDGTYTLSAREHKLIEQGKI